MVHWPSVTIDPDSILFADDDLVAVDKAAGVLCDASIDPKREHLGTALLQWAQDPGAHFLPAHRLDLDTSGIVLFARNRGAATALMNQFQERSVTKQYQAITQLASPAEWSAGQTINRRSYLRHRKGISDEVRSGGKPAESDFEVLTVDNDRALIRALPKTGRTHQLRVHLAALGAPILGDGRYGSADADRMWLHAEQLTLTHPTTGQPLVIRSRTNFALISGKPTEQVVGS